MSLHMHAYAVVTAVATWILLIAGGMVTSTDSGLAVPDWPLSYGMWFPPMVGGILYEHGHRMIAAVVGVMILALAGWLWRVEPRRWARWLGYSALGAVIIQALLGGLTVLWLLPPQVSIAHACLGQAVFCLVACLASATSPSWPQLPVRSEALRPARLRGLGFVVAALAAAQVLLGAIIRHTGQAVLLHGIGAVALLVAAIRVSRRVREAAGPPALRAAVFRLHALIGVQLIIGFSVFAHRGIVWLRTAHVAIGALVLAQGVALACELARCTARREALSPAPASPAEP